MTKPVTKLKTLAEVHAYIGDKKFNPYNFGEYLKDLLSQKIDISAVKVNGSTLLGYAAQKLNPAAVNELLERGANPTATTRDNKAGEWTPIYWAVYSGEGVEIPLEVTARVEVMKAIFSKADYKDLNIPERPLMMQASNPSTAAQLLIQGSSSYHDADSKVIPLALKMLAKKLETSEVLSVERLHHDTMTSLSISSKFVLSKAVQALKNGASPVMIGGKYTKVTQDALDAIAHKLEPLDDMPALAHSDAESTGSIGVEAQALMRATLSAPAPKTEFSDATIKAFLHISLHPNTKAYLESKGIDFVKLSDSAAEKILQSGFDPMIQEDDVFTANAREAIEKVQANLEANKALLLYSNIHPNSFVYMDETATNDLKMAAIDQLKSGGKPRDGEKALTAHAQELIDYIALEAKENISQWLAIKALDQETMDRIDEALKTINSSIDMLNQEILMRLKKGEDLGLKSDSDFVLALTPNTQEVISALCKELESNPTLLLHIRLVDSVRALISHEHKGGIDDLVTKAVNTLIIKKDSISDGDFAQYTDTLYNLLTSDPKQLLYFKDANVTKIRSDLGEEKFSTLEKLTVQAIKHGALSKLKDNTLTPFATKLFDEIIDSIKVLDITQRDNDFTESGMTALREFGAGSPDVLEYVNRLGQHLFPKEEPTSFVGSLLKWLSPAPAATPPKPDATNEKLKSTSAETVTMAPAATADEAIVIVPLVGNDAESAEA